MSNRTAREVHELLVQGEAESRFLESTFDDWCIWPLFRFQVGSALHGLTVTSKAPASFLRRSPLALKDVRTLLAPCRARFLAQTCLSGLLDCEDGLFRDIWIDELLHDLGKVFKFLVINSDLFLPRLKSQLVPYNVTSNSVDLLTRMLVQVWMPKDAPDAARWLHASIEKQFGTEIISCKAIQYGLAHFYWAKRIYRRLLKRIRPEYVFLTDPGFYPLVAAAKELGMKTVELSHGIILDRYSSFAYSWTDYARPFRPKMPLPDRFFVFGPHCRRELDALGFWGDSVRVVGSLRMDRYRDKLKRCRDPKVIRVLFSSQGYDLNNVALFLRDFMRLVPHGKDLRLQIKLHPVYDRDGRPYKELLGNDARVQILMAHEGPSTFELMVQADVHVSISSTCHYEAIGLGIPTLILPFTTHEDVLSLKDAGHAVLISTLGELLRHALNPPPAVPSSVSDFYYARNALPNLKRELNLLPA